MLRKGQVKQLAGMMLVVVSIATVVSTFNSIQNHTLDDSSEGLMESLEQYNPEVDVENQEQFRGLVTWNLLASQQCIYTNMVYEEGEFDEDINVGDTGIDVDDLRLRPTDSYSNVQSDGGYFTFFSESGDNPLRTVIEETGFEGQCMGTEPISITQGFGAILNDFPVDIWTSGLKGMSGYSVEGKYGAVSYNMKDTVLIKDEELFAMRLKEWWWGNDWFANVESPDFVRGQRKSEFIPPISNEELDQDDDVFYEEIWSFRVRMINVPIIIDESRFERDDAPIDRIRKITHAGEFVLCKGSEGRVKSNAADPFEDGVVRMERPVPRDIVYPKVEAFSGIKSCFGEDVAAGHYNPTRFAPIGNKMYFSEDQELNKEGLQEYWTPEIRKVDGELRSKDYGNLRIGKYEGEYLEMPVESRLATPVVSGEFLDVSSDLIYSKEFAVDTDECPRGGIPYDVSEMFRSDGGHHVDNIYTRDGEGVGFDPGSRVIYPLNRFNSDRLDARIDIDMIWGGKSKINITAYSEAGREMKAKVAVDNRLGGSNSEERNYVRYKIFDQDDGNALTNYDFDDVHTHQPDYLNITYYKDEDDTQYMELDFGRWGDGWAGGEEHQLLTASIDAGSEDIKHIAIEGDGGGNSAKAGFTVDDFTVNAPAAGCEPPANSGGLAR